MLYLDDIDDGFEPKAPPIMVSTPRPIQKTQIGYNSYDDQIKSKFIALVKPHNFFQIGGEPLAVQHVPSQPHSQLQSAPIRQQQQQPQLVYNQQPTQINHIPYQNELEHNSPTSIPQPQSYKQYSNIE